MNREIIYVADPCCSWCWGFSPTINALRDEYSDQAKFIMLMGGLRVGSHHVRHEQRKAYVRDVWARVGDISGQPFNLDILKYDNMSENTEPSCRAMIIMRERAPEKTFSFMKRLQNAFFSENRDISEESILADLAAEEGENRDQFLESLTSDDAKTASENEFAATRAMGVNGYPTTIVRKDDDYKILTAGYRPMDGVRQFFEHWMEQE